MIGHPPLHVHMTYVYSFFLKFLTSYDHMAKRSHYCIMVFFDSRVTCANTFIL